jgi:hypothetical protein
MNGMSDAILLSHLADAFLGTAHSTFSYVIHARALLIPHYVGHVVNGCTRAQSSQAGLVYSPSASSASSAPPPHRLIRLIRLLLLLFIKANSSIKYEVEAGRREVCMRGRGDVRYVRKR